MARNTLVRTYPIKGLVIFMAVAFLMSVGMIIFMAFMKDENIVIRILTWILCSAFALASGFMLGQQLLFYVELDDEYFIKHAFFSKYKIAYKRIDKLVNKDGFYDIYVDGKKISSIATNTKESQQIVLIMEKKGVKIDW